MSALDVFKGFAMVVSFFGLNAMVEEISGLIQAAYVSPLITSSLIIVIMMLAGISNILLPVWWVLFIAGLIAFFRTYLILKKEIDTPALVLLLIGILYSIIHYHNTYFLHNDSVAHWALVAKYLLKNNRFPDFTAEMVYFPSYPLGTAVFLYFFNHLFKIDAGLFMATQSVLYWFALLPLASLVQKNKGIGRLFAFLMAVFLYALNRHRYSLQVDALLGYMTAGATCILWLNRKKATKSIYAVWPIAISIVFLKTSGIVMSLSILIIAFCLNRGITNKAYKKALFAVLISSLLALLLWQVYFRVAFKGVSLGKHTISLHNYMSRIAGKDIHSIISLAKMMLKSLLKPDAQLLILPMYILAFIATNQVTDHRGNWLKMYFKLLKFTVLVFIIWQIMLFLTYIFTMSAKEASELASFERYQSTAVLYIIATVSMYIIECINHMGSISIFKSTIISFGMIVFSVLFIMLPFQGSSFREKLFDKRQGGQNSFDYILSLRKNNPDLEEGKSYIVFTESNTNQELSLIHKVSKYEFFSNNILMIYRQTGATIKDEQPVYHAMKQYDIYNKDTESISDLKAYLLQQIANYDYMILYDRDDNFENAVEGVLQEKDTDIKIMYSNH